jgi:hypothetical protein
MSFRPICVWRSNRKANAWLANASAFGTLPSRPMNEANATEANDAPETELLVGAGCVRGVLLNKLMEELLTGELREDVSTIAARTRVLMDELAIDAADGTHLPSAEEITATAWRTLQLPEVAPLRPHLVPEWPTSTPCSPSRRSNGLPLAGRRRRNKRAALKLMRKLLKKYAIVPERR